MPTTSSIRTVEVTEGAPWAILRVSVEQAAEIDRIFDRRPEIVVLQSSEDGEDPAKRALAIRRLRIDGYRRYARLPLGNKLFDLFRRPTAKT